jgi:hypothetical protein
MKKPAKKSGSGSQKPDKKAPGERKSQGGEDSEDEEEEEEEEQDSSDESDDESEDDGEKQKDDKGGKKQKSGDDELDLDSLPEATRNYIKKLRRESAKYRTKASNLEGMLGQQSERIKKLAGGDDDDTPPEKRVEELGATASTLAFENAILQTAVDHGIGKEGLKYYKFLVQERMQELGEGEELSDDDLEEIADEARAKTTKTRAKTSVTDGDSKSGKAPGTKSGVTVEQFARMTIAEKTEFRQKSPDQYAALWNEAMDKRLLFR